MIVCFFWIDSLSTEVLGWNAIKCQIKWMTDLLAKVSPETLCFHLLLLLTTYQNLFLKVFFWTRANHVIVHISFSALAFAWATGHSGSYFITLRLVYSHAETRSHLTWLLWQLHKARQIFKGDPTGLFFSSMDMLLWNCPAVRVVSGIHRIHWQGWALPQVCSFYAMQWHFCASSM